MARYNNYLSCRIGLCLDNRDYVSDWDIVECDDGNYNSFDGGDGRRLQHPCDSQVYRGGKEMGAYVGYRRKNDFFYRNGLDRLSYHDYGGVSSALVVGDHTFSSIWTHNCFSNRLQSHRLHICITGADGALAQVSHLRLGV